MCVRVCVFWESMDISGFGVHNVPSLPSSLISPIYYLSWSDGVIISPASGYGKWPHTLFTHAKMLIDGSFIYIFPQCQSHSSYFF